MTWRAMVLLAPLGLGLAALAGAGVPNEGDRPHALNLPRGEFVPGEYLVKYRRLRPGADFSLKAAAELADKHGLVSVSTIARFRIQKVRVKAGVSAEDALSRVRANREQFEFIEPNYYVGVLKDAHDTRWNEQWGPRRIEMPKAWDRETSAAKVRVAVLDTGIDIDHPDLRDNLWTNRQQGRYAGADGSPIRDDVHGVNLCNGGSSPDPRDDHDHGTHVAGIIAAVGDNGRGVAGVAWRTQLMAIKFVCRDGVGTVADMIRGIDYAITYAADILNASVGFRYRTQALATALSEAAATGMLIVAAAGNDGRDNDSDPKRTYPAAYDMKSLIAVAASDRADGLVSFSNRGRKSVHLAAPGIAILSTVPKVAYTPWDGTSMAAPHVTGCAALLKTVTSSRTAVEVKDALLKYADRLAGLRPYVQEGRRLNCARALFGV